MPRSMMPEFGRQLISVTGDKELLAKFDALTRRQTGSIVRKAVTAGSKEMRDEIKFQIKPAKTKGHSNKGMKANVGLRLKRATGNGQAAALAGVGVGKKRKAALNATGPLARALSSREPHFHLIALGTKARYTGHRSRRNKSGLQRQKTGNPIAYRGRMPADDFVGRAYAARASKVNALMIDIIRKGVEAAVVEG